MCLNLRLLLRGYRQCKLSHPNQSLRQLHLGQLSFNARDRCSISLLRFSKRSARILYFILRQIIIAQRFAPVFR